MERITLKNGLRIISSRKSDEHLPRISIGVKYGSIYDKEKHNGLAHFLEHMIFRDTKRQPYRRLIDFVSSKGGLINGSTKRFMSTYFGYSNPENFSKVAESLLEIVLQPAFKQKDFEKEKSVILNEMTQKKDDVFWYNDLKFLSILYKNHPARLPILGTKESVNRIKLSDLKDAYRKYFVPNNMVIGIFGNFDLNLLENLKSTFSEKSYRIVNKPTFSQEGKKPFIRDLTEEDSSINQTYIHFGLKTATLSNRDSYVMDVISNILGGGESSRLWKEIRIRNGLAYYVWAEHTSTFDYGYLNVNVETDKSQKRVLSIIKKELNKMKEKNVSQNELERGKNMIITNKLIEMDSPIESSNMFVEDEITWDDTNKVEKYLKNVKSVTSKEIMEVANKYFDEDNFATFIKRPK